MNKKDDHGYGPWRQYEKTPITRYEIRKGHAGRYDIHGVYIVRYRRRDLTDKCRFDIRKEERQTVSIQVALEKICLTPAHDSLVDMTMMGLSTIEKVFDRYEWYCQREEEKLKEARRKKAVVEKQIKKNANRSKRKLPARMVEV